MEREILFRGKRTFPYDKSWVYGGLLFSVYGGVPMILTDGALDDSCDLDFDYIPVDAGSVGQHTGLTDKDGVKIFEGDILETINSNSKYWIVEFKYGCFVAIQGNAKSYSCPLYQLMDDVTVKVAGNIYDNPELLST